MVDDLIDVVYFKKHFHRCLFPYRIEQSSIQLPVNGCKFNRIQLFQWIVRLNRVFSRTSTVFKNLVATSPLDQQRTAVNSPASLQDNYEAMTPTPSNINQTMVTTAQFNGILFSLFIEFFSISL